MKSASIVVTTALLSSLAGAAVMIHWQPDLSRHPIPTVHADSLAKPPAKGDSPADKRDHAWTLFKSLAAQPPTQDHHPAWQGWCAVGADDNNRMNLICPSQVNFKGPSLPVNAVPLTPTALTARMLHSFRHARQLAVGRNGQALEDFNLVAGQGTLVAFETSEVLYNLPTAKMIIHCFSDGKKYPVVSFDKEHKNIGELTQYFISSDRLATVQPDCRGKNETDGSFASLTDDSIVVKTVWAATVSDTSPDGSGSTTTVPVWDPGQLPGPGADPGHWPSRASLVFGPGLQQCPFTEPATYNPLVTTVPLSCFYSIPLTADQFSDEVKGKILKIKQYDEVGSTLGPVYMILLGFHVSTKEIPNWTWQTYWWSGRAASDSNGYGYGFQTPPIADPSGSDYQWRRYVMSTTYGDGADVSSSPSRAVYNPFLEGTFSLGIGDGTLSNCIVCHQYARFRSGALSHTLDDFGKIQHCGIGPSLTPADQTCQNYLQAGTKMDFLWSLADSNVPFNPQAEKNEFESALGNLLDKILEEREKKARHRKSN